MISFQTPRKASSRTCVPNAVHGLDIWCSAGMGESMDLRTIFWASTSSEHTDGSQYRQKVLSLSESVGLLDQLVRLGHVQDAFEWIGRHHLLECEHAGTFDNNLQALEAHLRSSVFSSFKRPQAPVNTAAGHADLRGDICARPTDRLGANIRHGPTV